MIRSAVAGKPTFSFQPCSYTHYRNPDEQWVLGMLRLVLIPAHRQPLLESGHSGYAAPSYRILEKQNSEWLMCDTKKT
jgi:hypothetical protein